MSRNHSIRLSDSQLTYLQEQSAFYECVSRHGITAGEPSWRILIQEIATGRIGIYDRTKKREKKRQPLTLDPHKAPAWWTPWPKSKVPNAMGAKYAVKASKHTTADLEAAGLVLLPEGGPGNGPLLVGLPGWVSAPQSIPTDDVPACPDWWEADSGDGMTLINAEERSGLSREEIEAMGIMVRAGVLVPFEEWEDMNAGGMARELAAQKPESTTDLNG